MWNISYHLIHEAHPFNNLKKPCKIKHLPKSQWLTQPGMQQAQSRLAQAEKKLQDLNKAGHDLIWNRLTGRDEKNPNSYGLIFCKKCERTWPWCKRHANLPKSLCRTSKSSAPAPAWVKNFDQPDAVNTEIPHPQPNTIDKENPESLLQPRRRIRGKTKIDTNPNANSVPETAHVSPTASHVSHSASSSGGPALSRAGIG